MQSTESFEQFVGGGLASLRIEADEIELVVMRAAHDLYWPAFRALCELDLSDAPPEPGADLSRAPVA